MSVTDTERELEGSDEHEVTPLELFFDLTFVFAMTQVTILLADDPTGRGVFRGMLVLAALWWAWSVYAWLSSSMDVDEGGVRLVMLASMGAMFGVALAVPGRLGTTPSSSASRISSSACSISFCLRSSPGAIPTDAMRSFASAPPR